MGSLKQVLPKKATLLDSVWMDIFIEKRFTKKTKKNVLPG